MKTRELTNHQREYLGLEPVPPEWIKMELSDTHFIYRDGDVIRKEVETGDDYYHELHLNLQTSNDGSIILPKTKRGKPQKLTLSSLKKQKGYGNYFFYNGKYALIGNYTTQQTYYYSIMASLQLESLETWLDGWIEGTTKEYLQEINQFHLTKRVHCKFKEGDFFRFKIDRGIYGYGRIIFDFDRLRREKLPYWKILFGRPLVVNVYHIMTEQKLVDLEQLRALPAIPSQYIMDNKFYYGECEIIGNLPLLEDELDYPIMYGKSSSFADPDKIIFQRGPVYKFIDYTSEKLIGDFRFNGISYTLHVNRKLLSECIKQKSNEPYWNNGYPYFVKKDLRNPKNSKAKELILEQFSKIEPKTQ